MKKKVNVFGKKLPVFMIVLLGIAVVSAALISYWGTITGLVTVSQGLRLDGGDYNVTIEEVWDDEDFTSLESRVFASAHRLSNDADVNAEVNLVKTGDSGTSVTDDFTANYYATNLREGQLILDNKNTDWTLTTDGKGAILDYTFVGGSFSYDLSATGLEVDKEYVLIYYADDEPRYNNWGGNPALELGIVNSDSSGNVASTSGSKLILGGLLPYATDWNAGGYPDTLTQLYADYCGNVEGDGYEHCRGAKIWLIPSDTYDKSTERVTVWAQSRFLFETDLLGWDHKSPIGAFTVPANNNVDFVIVNNFPKMLVPGDYTITTTVSPTA